MTQKLRVLFLDWVLSMEPRNHLGISTLQLLSKGRQAAVLGPWWIEAVRSWEAGAPSPWGLFYRAFGAGTGGLCGFLFFEGYWKLQVKIEHILSTANVRKGSEVLSFIPPLHFNSMSLEEPDVPWMASKWTVGQSFPQPLRHWCQGFGVWIGSVFDPVFLIT